MMDNNKQIGNYGSRGTNRLTDVQNLSACKRYSHEHNVPLVVHDENDDFDALLDFIPTIRKPKGWRFLRLLYTPDDIKNSFSEWRNTHLVGIARTVFPDNSIAFCVLIRPRRFPD